MKKSLFSSIKDFDRRIFLRVLCLAGVCLVLNVISPAVFPLVPAGAETAGVPGNGEADLPVIINADEVEYSMKENKIIARGDVEVIHGDVRLLSNEFEYFRDSNFGLARGDVVMIRPGERMTGEHLRFDFNTKKGNYIAARFYSAPFYGAGRKVEKVGEEQIRVEGGYITTSDFDNPEYRIRASHTDIYPGDKAVSRHVRFKVGKVPVFYLPRYTQDLSDKEPAFTITPGYFKDWGGFVLTSYRYKFNPQLETTLHLDYRERKDVAWGVDVSYDTRRYGDGLLRTYYMNERTITSDRIWGRRLTPTTEWERYRVELRHKWKIDSRTMLIGQYNRLSDDKLLKDYFARRHEQDASPNTYMVITRGLPKATLSLRTDVRVNRFDSAVERLPEVKYLRSNNEIGDSGFYLRDETTASYLIKKSAAPSTNHPDTFRLDTDNEVSYPMKVAFLEVKPFTGLRNTYYSETPRGQSDLLRNVFRSGVDVSTKFYRVFDYYTDALGMNINRLRHVITPSAAYLYQHAPTHPNAAIEQYDEIDDQEQSHLITFSLENKLQTKRNKQSVDLSRLILTAPYLLHDDPSNQQGLTAVTWDWETRPLDWVLFDLEGSYNTKEDRVTEANFDISFRTESDDWYVRFGHRYHAVADDELTTEFGYKINQKWRFWTYHRFNFETKALEQQEYTLRRDLHSWYVDMTFTHTDEIGEEILFIFTLKAFPNIEVEGGTSYRKRPVI